MSHVRRGEIERLLAEHRAGLPMSDGDVPWRLVEELLAALDDAEHRVDSAWSMGWGE